MILYENNFIVDERSTTIPRAEMPTGVGPEANAGG